MITSKFNSQVGIPAKKINSSFVRNRFHNFTTHFNNSSHSHLSCLKKQNPQFIFFLVKLSKMIPNIPKA